MKLRLIRIALALAGSALGLWIAALLLDKVSISGTAFLIAVVIFTVLSVVLLPIVGKLAEKYADSVRGLSALVSTAIALIVTALVSDGLSIDGIGAWILATLIVWLAILIIGVILAKLVLGKYEQEEKR
jgi:uncharacterized membrane protein YvlD (DUF360 family)